MFFLSPCSVILACCVFSLASQTAGDGAGVTLLAMMGQRGRLVR